MGQLNLGNGANFVGGTGGYLADAPKDSIIQYVVAPSNQVNNRFTSSSSTPTNTGIYIQITPKVATSHIHIQGIISNYHGSSQYCYNRLKNTTSGEWVTDNSNDQAWIYGVGNDTAWYEVPVYFIDAPNSTAQQTYQIWGYTGSATAYWGWSSSAASTHRNFCNLCAFEVAQ